VRPAEDQPEQRRPADQPVPVPSVRQRHHIRKTPQVHHIRKTQELEHSKTAHKSEPGIPPPVRRGRLRTEPASRRTGKPCVCRSPARSW